MMSRIVAAVAAVAMVASSCARSQDGEHPVARQEVAVRGLCHAEMLAEEGDLAGAQRVFQDRSHQYLHELADRAAGRDRAVAGALLEAKERVEAALADGSAPAGVAGLLGDLRVATLDAIRVIGKLYPGSWKRCD